MKKLKRKLAIAGASLGLGMVVLLVTVVASFMQIVLGAGASMSSSPPDTGVGRISFADTSGDTRSLLDLSLCFLGTPYEYGQATLTSTDCSGFTMQAYDLAGTSISLPHSAQDQFSYGTLSLIHI